MIYRIVTLGFSVSRNPEVYYNVSYGTQVGFVVVNIFATRRGKTMAEKIFSSSGEPISPEVVDHAIRSHLEQWSTGKGIFDGAVGDLVVSSQSVAAGIACAWNSFTFSEKDGSFVISDRRHKFETIGQIIEHALGRV